MTRPEKKAAELRALRAVLDRVDLGIAGVPEIVEGESPDFRLIWPDGRTVGVEVAETMDEPMAAGMGLFGAVETIVRRTLERESLLVQIHMHSKDGLITLLGAKDENDRSVANPRTIAAAIVSLARDQIAASVRRRVYFREAHDHMQRFREWVRSGAIGPIPRRLRGVADSLESRGIQFLDRVAIYLDSEPGVYRGASQVGLAMRFVPQGILDRKTEHKLPEYRANLGPGVDVWIVLLAGQLFASGVPDFLASGETYISGFDRVFYVDVDKTRVFHAFELRNVRV